MIAVDDLNDWTGFLGGHPQAKTPRMDALAAKGVNFTNAHCPAPGCSPSRNAILLGAEPTRTGLYPFYNLVDVESEVLEPYLPMPLFFRQNGYFTAGFEKVWHNPDNKWRQDEQWDIYEPSGGNKNLKLDAVEGYVPGQKRLTAAPADNPPSDFGDRRSADRAVGILEMKHKKPFFLAVGFILPHTPFIAPRENFDRFPFPIAPPPMLAGDLADIPLAGRSNAQLYVDIPLKQDKAWEKIRRGYLAAISFTDDNVGLVLDALEKSPYADNTIIMLWSDHGYHLGEKHTFSKFSLWEEATRTPFIIYDPRNRSGNGQATPQPVSLIDIYRTLADLTGLTPPDYVDGESLIPLLQNPQMTKRTPALTTWGRGNYTVRSLDWRYTRYFDGSEELYRHSDDPNEWTNLAGEAGYRTLIDKLAEFMPKTEAPQVTSGRALYNVADADEPERNIRSYQNLARKYKELGLQPPLGVDE
jgi:arylsulfatase A-like enzyme